MQIDVQLITIEQTEKRMHVPNLYDARASLEYSPRSIGAMHFSSFILQYFQSPGPGKCVFVWANMFRVQYIWIQHLVVLGDSIGLY